MTRFDDLTNRLLLKKQLIHKLQTELDSHKKEAKEIEQKIELLNVDYNILIESDDFRHTRNLNLSPYAGYEKTMCSEVFRDYDIDDDGIALICPKCRSIVERFLNS